jgi:mono/diheme cytochrome c family protein
MGASASRENHCRIKLATKENEVSKMSEKRGNGAWPVLSLVLAAGAAVTFAGTGWAQQPPPPAPKIVVTDYDMKKAATPAALSEVELSGKKLFIQRCALCHDVLGQPATTTVGPWIDGEVVKARGEDAVRQKIMTSSPRMPGWRHTLEPQQIDSIISYLKTVTPDQKPKPGGPVTGPIE